MNICIKNIYIFFLSIIVFYLFYKINKEPFQITTTGYQADIEAIRNLSNIASQLNSSNQLTMPGSLNVTNNLTVSGELSVRTGNPSKQIMLGTSQIKFRGDGLFHYALTNDTDGKFKITNVSSNSTLGVGHVNDCITTDSNGNTTINGTLKTKEVNNAVPKIVVLNSISGTIWTVPPGVFRCKVTCIGAGGGGAGGCSVTFNTTNPAPSGFSNITYVTKGGGGGGGGLCTKIFENLIPGTNATYSVGKGGTGGTGDSIQSLAGGNTSFTYNNSTMTANGGGNGGNGRWFYQTSVNPQPALGGVASGGDININGGNGGYGVLNGGGTFVSSKGGDAPLGYGYGGADSFYNQYSAINGNNGTGYGGGGSGGYSGSTATGGNGSNGVIIIEY